MKSTGFSAAVSCLLCAAALIFAGCGEGSKNESSAVSASKAEASASDEERGGTVNASWFDDAVFVGDSVTLKLSYYCESRPEALGNAQFFCAGSLGYTSSLWDLYDENAVHPYYKGNIELAENCAVLTGASKVFIMLGMNDIGLWGIDGAAESCKELVSRIKTNSPDVTIYIQSVTPIIMGKELDNLNNELIREFNERLKAYCEEQGIKYLDIYNLLADENGYLPLEYCGDEGAMGIHFNDTSCQMWVDYLKENV